MHCANTTVGFHKLFKGNVYNLWDEWLVKDGLNVDETAKCHRRDQMEKMIAAGMSKVSK